MKDCLCWDWVYLDGSYVKECLTKAECLAQGGITGYGCVLIALVAILVLAIVAGYFMKRCV